jgi:lysyl-tRNA synthetase class I
MHEWLNLLLDVLIGKVVLHHAKVVNIQHGIIERPHQCERDNQKALDIASGLVAISWRVEIIWSVGWSRNCVQCNACGIDDVTYAESKE